MSQRIYVSLEVAVPEGVDPAVTAEAIFDHACKGEYLVNGIELVDSVDSYDYTAAL
jgi:hypothetical protein